MKLLNKILNKKIIIIFILFYNSLYSQTQIQWVKNFGGPTWDVPHNVKIDNRGNLYVAGTFDAAFGDLAYSVLIKYNNAGDTIWSRKFIPPDTINSGGSNLLIDDSLNLFISGRYILKYNPQGDLLYSRYYGCSTNKMAFDKTNNVIYAGLTQTTSEGVALLKCNKNGDLIWRKTYAQWLDPYVSGIIVDRQNNIILTASYNAGQANDWDFVTVKFNSDGNYIWSKTYHGGDPTGGYDEPCGVILDSSDNIIVSGRSNGPTGGSNYYTVKYDTSGNVLWESRIPGGGAGATDMKIDKQGFIYICGVTNSSSYSTLKYNSIGQLLWMQTVPGTGLPPDASLTLDTLGNIYTACNRNIDGYSSYQILKYSNNGQPLWNVIYPGSGIKFFYSTDIIVDNSGNVFVTGEGQIMGNSYDFVTMRINQTTGITQNSNVVPKSYSLSQNYPNPFNPSTNINYDISISGLVSLKVFDISGKEIETLVNQKQAPGSYSVTFDASNYPSGVYFYRLETNNFSETKKMILLK